MGGLPNEDARLLGLAEAGRRLAAVTGREQLYEVASRLALDVLAASSASIARLERERGLVRVLCTVGELADPEHEQPVDEVHRLADCPQLAVVAEDARPRSGHVDDAQTGAGHRQRLHAMGMHTSISIPIVLGDMIWGELTAARTASLPPFSRADAAAGEALGGLLAAALMRIHEVSELHELASCDALTGLGNRRAVDEHLERRFAPPGPIRPVAAVICDVDGLKAVNDRFGHDAGDQLLREVAASLSLLASRYPDALAARLGGDEFCLVLEGLSDAEVSAVSDQLSASAAELSHGARLSCGWARVAGWPGEASSPAAAARALLRLAAAAQYRAKRAGRSSASVSMEPVAQPGEVQRGWVRTALAALRAADTSVEARLAAVTSTAAEQLDAGAWGVSRRCGDGTMQVVARDAQRGVSLMPNPMWAQGAEVDVARYPDTVAALEGGSFHATMADGERSEREFLAGFGCDEVIAAGVRSDPQTAWLVEIYGDAVTAPLRPHEGLLRVLVELAAARPRALSPQAETSLTALQATQ